MKSSTVQTSCCSTRSLSQLSLIESRVRHVVHCIKLPLHGVTWLQLVRPQTVKPHQLLCWRKSASAAAADRPLYVSQQLSEWHSQLSAPLLRPLPSGWGRPLPSTDWHNDISAVRPSTPSPTFWRSWTRLCRAVSAVSRQRPDRWSYFWEIRLRMRMIILTLNVK